MYENLLPLGSVVSLSEGGKKLLIAGRIQTREGDDRIYDYCACYYPEGILGGDSMFFFDSDAVHTVFFIGYQDPDELVFRSDVLANLGELQVVDGQIVPVEE